MLKKFVIAFGSLLAITGVTYAFYNFVYLKSPKLSKAGLKVETFYPGAKVYINSDLAGETPFSSQNLMPGEVTVAVDGKYGHFEDKITLEKGTFSLLNLKIAPSSDFTSSQVLWLERQNGGQTLSILSNILGVRVSLDGEDRGLAPLTVEKVSAGDHTVTLSKEGFETVEVTVNVMEDHKVNFKASLSPKIIPSKTPDISFEDSELVRVQNFTADNIPGFLLSNPASWAKGLAFSIETNPDTKLKFDYFLDFEGKIYDSQGFSLSSFSGLNASEGLRFGYLADSSEQELSTKASKALTAFVQSVFGDLKPQIEIIETGLGYLKVREEASLDAAEVGRVNVGDKFRALEEESGWYKIEYKKDEHGWISADYTKSVEEEN